MVRSLFNHYKKLLSSSERVISNFDKIIGESINIWEETPTFCELDFRLAINNMKSKKTAGIDGILGEMIKTGRDEFTKPLTTIFNKILNSGSYPTSWSQVQSHQYTKLAIKQTHKLYGYYPLQ